MLQALGGLEKAEIRKNELSGAREAKRGELLQNYDLYCSKKASDGRARKREQLMAELTAEPQAAELPSRQEILQDIAKEMMLQAAKPPADAAFFAGDFGSGCEILQDTAQRMVVSEQRGQNSPDVTFFAGDCGSRCEILQDTAQGMVMSEQAITPPADAAFFAGDFGSGCEILQGTVQGMIVSQQDVQNSPRTMLAAARSELIALTCGPGSARRGSAGSPGSTCTRGPGAPLSPSERLEAEIVQFEQELDLDVCLDIHRTTTAECAAARSGLITIMNRSPIAFKQRRERLAAQMASEIADIADAIVAQEASISEPPDATFFGADFGSGCEILQDTTHEIMCATPQAKPKQSVTSPSAFSQYRSPSDSIISPCSKALSHRRQLPLLPAGANQAPSYSQRAPFFSPPGVKRAPPACGGPPPVPAKLSRLMTAVGEPMSTGPPPLPNANRTNMSTEDAAAEAQESEATSDAAMLMAERIRLRSKAISQKVRAAATAAQLAAEGAADQAAAFAIRAKMAAEAAVVDAPAVNVAVNAARTSATEAEARAAAATRTAAAAAEIATTAGKELQLTDHEQRASAADVRAMDGADEDISDVAAARLVSDALSRLDKAGTNSGQTSDKLTAPKVFVSEPTRVWAATARGTRGAYCHFALSFSP
jgi:hypothetical protein